MKTILALTGGGETDDTVFETALGAARPLNAHVDFLHVHPGVGDAALATPHMEFAMGAGLHEALDRMSAEAAERSVRSRSFFARYCRDRDIAVYDVPGEKPQVSVAWIEEKGYISDRVVQVARHHDMTVLARTHRPNGMPQNLIERVLIESGRPVLLAPPQPRPSLTKTVLVFWKEGAAPARALAAAVPLLAASANVLIVGVVEKGLAGRGGPVALCDLAEALQWHGIRAAQVWLPYDPSGTERQLRAAADRYDADLLVMGAYGHSRARETIFGGCTQSFLDSADRPVLLMH